MNSCRIRNYAEMHTYLNIWICTSLKICFFLQRYFKNSSLCRLESWNLLSDVWLIGVHARACVCTYVCGRVLLTEPHLQQMNFISLHFLRFLTLQYWISWNSFVTIRTTITKNLTAKVNSNILYFYLEDMPWNIFFLSGLQTIPIVGNCVKRCPDWQIKWKGLY